MTFDETDIIIKCKNYIICNEDIPISFIHKNEYICTSCDINFGPWRGGKGKLKILEKNDCIICYENKEQIELPKCNHSLCIDCFKKIYYKEQCICKCNNKEEHECDACECFANESDPTYKCPMCRQF